MSIDTAQRWERAFGKKQQKLVQTSKNLVDEVWKSRPAPEIRPVFVHPLEFAGRSTKDKLNDLREKLKQEKARGIIIAALDEVSLSCCLSLYSLCFYYLTGENFLKFQSPASILVLISLIFSIKASVYSLFSRSLGCITFVGVMYPTAQLFMHLL